ncbi:MAG: hypothetical protein GY795_01340 [Desulfobacterales bacterium]|nr:hypothetical protein [Desulfobacterales bacterium]
MKKIIMLCILILITFPGVSLTSALQKRVAKAHAKADAEDSDNDGMPDWWEKRFSSEPHKLDPEKDDSQEDPDSDSLINLDEFRHGTHPFRKDTDDDLLEDWEEIFNYKTDPAIADTDGGGKPDGYEVKNNGDPLNPDDDNISVITITIELKQGWNLVSFPVMPLVSSPPDIMASISGSFTSVYSQQQEIWKYYDPRLTSSLSSIKAGWGYWINMDNPATLTVSGSASLQPVPLEEGWNMVGYNSLESMDVSDALASIHGKYKGIFEYDEEWIFYDPLLPSSRLKKLNPGHGYWIDVTEACTWVLP